jgi:hypothetical protein
MIFKSKPRSKPKAEIIKVVIPEFITHIHQSKKKLIKINGQKMYSGLHPMVRTKIVDQMHDYVRTYINEELQGRDLSRLYPLNVSLEFHAPINYGSVRQYKGEIRWKAPKPGYIPNWDADNQWIWGKVFNDTLTEEGYIEDDNIKYVTSSGKVKYRQVKDFKDRKLVFIIKQDK